MIKISLRKIKPSDKNYFAKWWMDKELLKLTSGILKLISDEEVDRYFQAMLNSKDDYNFIILADGKIIGQKTKWLARNADCDWGEKILGQGIWVKINQAPYQKGKKRWNF